MGDLDFEYTIEAWSDTNPIDDGVGGHIGDTTVSCVNVHLEAPLADGVSVGNNSFHGPFGAGILRAGESETWGLEISIDDDNACQGQRAAIFARVVATSPDDESEPTPEVPGGTPTDDDGTGGGTPNPPQSPVTPVNNPGQPSPPTTPSNPTNQPLPPAAPLDPTPTRGAILERPIPPSSGDGGLIGKAPKSTTNNEPELWLLALAGILAVSGGVFCFAGFALDQRSARK